MSKSKNNKDFWWCQHCQMIVEPKHVTFEEQHDKRYGGCGQSISGLPPTVKSVMDSHDYWKRHFNQALKDIKYLKNKIKRIEDTIKKQCEINIKLY